MTAAPWDFVASGPAPALAGSVLRYVGYVERTAAPLRRVEVASSKVVLVVGLGPALRLHDACGAPAAARRSFVAGPSDARTVTEHDGEQHGIQVDLAPLAARALLGVPPGELVNRSVDLEDVLGRGTGLLVERLAGTPTWEERFALLDAVFARRLAEAPPPAPAVVHAWTRLAEAHGALPVAGLAREVGWSRRHLAARFREELGLPPKPLARILRFERALGLLTAGRAGLAETAFACGYADQAHLSRDFRAFAGAPPASFLARRLPDGGGFSGA